MAALRPPRSDICSGGTRCSGSAPERASNESEPFSIGTAPIQPADNAATAREAGVDSVRAVSYASVVVVADNLSCLRRTLKSPASLPLHAVPPPTTVVAATEEREEEAAAAGVAQRGKHVDTDTTPHVDTDDDNDEDGKEPAAATSSCETGNSSSDSLSSLGAIGSNRPVNGFISNWHGLTVG